jgi:hypothetical protein
MFFCGSGLVFAVGAAVSFAVERQFCFAVGQPLVVAVATAPSFAVGTFQPAASLLLWMRSSCRLSWVTFSTDLLPLTAVQRVWLGTASLVLAVGAGVALFVLIAGEGAVLFMIADWDISV